MGETDPGIDCDWFEFGQGVAEYVCPIFIENRLALLYTYESDLGDGWENAEIHNDPLEIREKALKMGANIINYAFKN